MKPPESRPDNLAILITSYIPFDGVEEYKRRMVNRLDSRPNCLSLKDVSLQSFSGKSQARKPESFGHLDGVENVQGSRIAGGDLDHHRLKIMRRGQTHQPIPEFWAACISAYPCTM
jgi:hypothetical protein